MNVQNESKSSEPKPSIGVLGYGSILAPEELAEIGRKRAQGVMPVRVHGFKRLFNQEASWRDTDKDKRGVLNVVRDTERWFNAVLVTDLNKREFRAFRERERGYALVEVKSENIEPYDESDESTIGVNELILVATGTKTSGEIEPIPSYVRVCKEGAKQWGEEFYEDFLTSTNGVEETSTESSMI